MLHDLQVNVTRYFTRATRLYFMYTRLSSEAHSLRVYAPCKRQHSPKIHNALTLQSESIRLWCSAPLPTRTASSPYGAVNPAYSSTSYLLVPSATSLTNASDKDSSWCCRRRRPGRGLPPVPLRRASQDHPRRGGRRHSRAPRARRRLAPLRHSGAGELVTSQRY